MLLSTAAHGFLGLFAGLLHLPPWLKLTEDEKSLGVFCTGLHSVVVHLDVLRSPEYFMSLNDCAFAAVEQWWSRGGAVTEQRCSAMWGSDRHRTAL